MVGPMGGELTDGTYRTMTAQEASGEFSFASWLVQSAVGFFGPLAILVIAETGLSISDSIVGQVLSYAFLGSVAAAIALLVGRFAEGCIQEGVWIWLLPSCLEMAAAFWSVFSDGVAATWRGLFFIAGPGRGEESLGVVLLTWPVWSCCCYSGAMWLLWRRRNRKKPPQLTRV